MRVPVPTGSATDLTVTLTREASAEEINAAIKAATPLPVGDARNQAWANINKQIAAERVQISVLEAQWQREAGPDTIQKLAESSLGMNDTTTVQLSSLSELPRRGDEPLNGEQLHAASAQLPASPAPVVKVAVRSGM